MSGPMVDASGDGISNLLKYAMGLDPTIKTSALQVTAAIDGALLTYGFSRFGNTPDISVTVEVSRDLSDWAPTISLISSSSNGDGAEDVVFRSDVAVSSEARQFLRIKVIQQ